MPITFGQAALDKIQPLFDQHRELRDRLEAVASQPSLVQTSRELPVQSIEEREFLKTLRRQARREREVAKAFTAINALYSQSGWSVSPNARASLYELLERMVD